MHPPACPCTNGTGLRWHPLRKCMAHERTSTEPRKHISAEDARGGEIILRTRTRRLIFIAGLVGLVIVGLIVRFAVYG